MNALRVHRPGGPDNLFYESAPRPIPQEGEVLIKVKAVAISGQEVVSWSMLWETRDHKRREFPIPGHEFSGEIVELGPNVQSNEDRIAIGSQVFAHNSFGRDGGMAEYVLARAEEVAAKPKTLDHAHAAAIPVSGLTAWQALFVHGNLQAGESIFITGATGGVGMFALQLAVWKGARVVVIAREGDAELLKSLGAAEVHSLENAGNEEGNLIPEKVDFVLDCVGGDLLKRSWTAVKEDGTLISVAEPADKSPEAQQHRTVKCVWFIMDASGEQLKRIADLVDEGHVKVQINRTMPLAEGKAAYKIVLEERVRGKVVLIP